MRPYSLNKAKIKCRSLRIVQLREVAVVAQNPAETKVIAEEGNVGGAIIDQGFAICGVYPCK